MSLMTTKFLLAVLPLLVLGYTFGTLAIAAFEGWQVHPILIVLNTLGIVVAIDEFQHRYPT